MIPSDASSSSRTTEKNRIREEEEGDDDDDEPPPKVVDRDPSGRFVRYAEPLGKGAYKSVWRAFDEEEGVEVAWNQLRVDHLTDLDANKLRAEVALLSALRHPNVIRLHHAWAARAANGGETVYFVTELMTSGTLKRYLRKTTGSIRPKFLKHICRQVLSGLSYLHTCQPPVIHRDLKCENIFVNGNTGEVKLGDLGLATVKPFRHVTSVIGTPEFMAPELYDEKYDEKVDVYAFGMCVLEMVTKEYPYCECSNQAQIYKKVTNGIKPASLDKIEQGPLRELIEICLRFNPDERPAATDLLNHPFLTAELGGGTSSDPLVGHGIVSPEMRRDSIDASGFLSNSIDIGNLDNLHACISNGGSVSALSAGLISQCNNTNLNASNSALAINHNLQLSTPSATPSTSNVDIHRATSLDTSQFGQIPGQQPGIEPLQLAQSNITRQMVQIPLSNTNANNPAYAEVISAPATLHHPPSTPSFAMQPDIPSSTTASRSENASSTAAVTPSHGQVDFVKRIDSNTLLLKMISRRANEPKHKCIKFPFILDQDTPEDVVHEMVREQVLDEDDRELAVCNIRRAVERGKLQPELATNTIVGSHNSSESGYMSSSCPSLVSMRRTSSSGRSQPDDVQSQLARYHAYQQMMSSGLAAMSMSSSSGGRSNSPGHYPPNALAATKHQQHSPTDGSINASPFSNIMPRPVPVHAHHRRSASSGTLPFELLQQHHHQHGSSFSTSHLSSSFPSPTPLSTSLSEIGSYSPRLSLLGPRGRSYAGDSSAFHGFGGNVDLPRNTSHLPSVYSSNDLIEKFFNSRRDHNTPSTPGELYADYRDTPCMSAPQRVSSIHSQQGLANAVTAAKVKQISSSNVAVNRAHLQQQQQQQLSQQHGYDASMAHITHMRGTSFTSSPRSDHGDLTTDGTTATGDTSMISPLFDSPRLDDGSSAASPGELKETVRKVSTTATGFAEVLMARSPSTAGIGVIVDPMLMMSDEERDLAVVDTHPLTNDSTIRSYSRTTTEQSAVIGNTNHTSKSIKNNLSISIPRDGNGLDLVTNPMSPLRGVGINTGISADRSSPPRSSACEPLWHDDDDAMPAAVGVDVSDPKLIELWEKQRREAEEMARTHMVEWEQLVQDLREKRMADRSAPSFNNAEN